MSLTSDTQARLKKYRISESELGLIEKQLGRPMREIEWPLFSALWSEHCSYKSSKIFLKKLFNKSKRVMQSFGENAGVIDLGEGERIAFKMESHNHPSFIEPYQGAATGVGGILRDIFTMGARPIMLANYLCFGELSAPRMKSIVDGVVRGIGGYGNCVGVPTVTGQTEFYSSYNQNVLVNALAVGLFSKGEKIHLSKASGPGNLVVYVGAKTGRDGVNGASMASDSFDESSEANRPTVQIGDPFFEKLLIESCLEVMKEDLLVAIQDMGAAGLTSSSFEMAAKGEVGLDLHLDMVPLRDSSMTAEDILLSESQERMLLVCEPAKLPRIQQIFEKWGLDACKIGEIRKESVVRIYFHKELLTEIDPQILVEQAPQYQRPYAQWTEPRKTNSVALKVGNPGEELAKILKSEHATHRDWVYRNYDQRVGAQTIADCEESLGIVRLPESKRALALVLGCRPYVMRTDARLGGFDTIAYPAIELALKGFTPLAVTDCLNFGNPQKPEIMGEFVASLEAMSAACEKLELPIISGNVSFYNETLERNITSTPATGIVGLRSKIAGIPKSSFTTAGETIFVIECEGPNLNGKMAEFSGQALAFSGNVDVEAVQNMVQHVIELCSESVVSSSRIVGKFGLAYALARMCDHGVGAQITLANVSASDLFTEKCYQAVLTTSEPKALAKAAPQGVRVREIGRTGGSDLVINDILRMPVGLICKNLQSGLGAYLES